MSTRLWPVALCCGFFFTSVILAGGGFPEKPPPAHTGGFDEPTCYVCHFDGTLNDGAGLLVMRGLEQERREEDYYTIEVMLHRPGMMRAGFELSARFAAGEHKGKQAGEFVIDDEYLALDTQDDVSYVHQTLSGADRVVGDSVFWRFRWKPPESTTDIAFHVAANAANGDDSAFGDAIYLQETLLKRDP